MILAITTEQLLIIFFAGGPGLAALIVQVIQHLSGGPKRKADVASTLTTTSLAIMERMEEDIEKLTLEVEEEKTKRKDETRALRGQLRVAEDKIIRLEERLEAADKYAAIALAERERRVMVELEIEQLKAMVGEREEAAEVRQHEREQDEKVTDVSIVDQTEAVEVDVIVKDEAGDQIEGAQVEQVDKEPE